MAGAISGTTIASLVAAVVGAGLQYKASSDAQKRTREETQRALRSQKALQLEAEKHALDRAGDYETPKRQQEQQQIADEITQALVAPVSESQAIRAGQQTTQGDVSSEYTTTKAASDLQTVKDAENLARMLGRTTSAGRLRLNEGIRLMDTGQQIGTLGNFSRGQDMADRYAIQGAGQVDPGMVLAGSLLQSAGTAGLMAGGSAASGGNAGQGLSQSAGGLGLKAGGGTGLKMNGNIAGWFAA